jgi:hypothetical protein
VDRGCHSHCHVERVVRAARWIGHGVMIFLSINNAFFK